MSIDAHKCYVFSELPMKQGCSADVNDGGLVIKDERLSPPSYADLCSQEKTPLSGVTDSMNHVWLLCASAGILLQRNVAFAPACFLTLP